MDDKDLIKKMKRNLRKGTRRKEERKAMVSRYSLLINPNLF